MILHAVLPSATAGRRRRGLRQRGEQVVGDRCRRIQAGWRRSARGVRAPGASDEVSETVSMMACWRWVMSARQWAAQVSQEQVIPPDREQRVVVGFDFDARSAVRWFPQTSDEPGGS